MITIREGQDFIPYNNIKNPEEKILFYPDIFSGKIIKKVIDNIYTENTSIILCLTVGIAQLTQKIYKIESSQQSQGSLAFIILQDGKVKIMSRKNKYVFPCKKGSLLIFGAEFRRDAEFSIPTASIRLVEENYLPSIYLNTEKRLQYGEMVYSKLENVRSLPIWKQCPQNILDLSIIGKGSYGNVYKGNIGSLKFAVKFSKLKPESIQKPFSRDFASWYEVFFLKDIFRPLIQENVCPNLPLIYDAFTCKDCKLVINEKEEEHPCVITIVELANGDLKDYLSREELSEDEIYSALFQIMAGLCTIQKYGQILNFDVKKENILFYKVTPGGYFQYTIMNKTFFVPNYGYLFIINDFGISRSMSPKYPMYKNEKDLTYRLGSRYAFIKDGKFVPIKVQKQIDSEDNVVPANEITWDDGTISTGAEFRMYRKNGKLARIKGLKDVFLNFSYFTEVALLDFFENPETIPPFEFYNDTQDAIRMFVGGKRTTQKGFHREQKNVSKRIIEELRPYVGKGESMKDGIFSKDPAQVLACYFILDFFGKHTNYLEKPDDEIIGVYKI
jgi:serine/threonine protein kinase